jgi:hypothetical protein
VWAWLDGIATSILFESRKNTALCLDRVSANSTANSTTNKMLENGNCSVSLSSYEPRPNDRIASQAAGRI